jgi:hypothetical protein
MSCPHYPRLGSTRHENKFGWLASGLRQRRQRHLHAIPPEHIGDLLKNARGINALRLRLRFSELTDDVSLPIRSNRPLAVKVVKTCSCPKFWLHALNSSGVLHLCSPRRASVLRIRQGFAAFEWSNKVIIRRR